MFLYTETWERGAFNDLTTGCKGANFGVLAYVITIHCSRTHCFKRLMLSKMLWRRKIIHKLLSLLHVLRAWSRIYNCEERVVCIKCIRCYNYKASVLPWGETVYAQQNGKKMWLESDFWWTCHIALEVKYNGEKKIAMDGEWHAMFIVQSLATPPGALVALNIKVPPERMLQKWLPFRISSITVQH